MQNTLTVTTKMKFHSQILQNPVPNWLTPTYLSERRHLYGECPKFCNPKKYPGSRKLQFVHIRSQQSSGAARFSSATVKATSENAISKEDDVVFVAGATGKVGSRTVRELLKLGFRVRAGVRSAQRAESLLQSVREMKVEATSGLQPIEKLEIVECDLEIPDRIIPALGGASVVICCIGASEKEIFDVTGPYRIDYLATKNLIDAATFVKVDHFILLTSLGTNKVGFPAAILNLFWGVLIWKRKAEEALIESGLPYTIVRPGGMERPTDSFKETHNITLAQEDTLFGGLVSNLQVAELMAVMAQNRDLSYCKIVEVVAETTAPLTPMEELLEKIPSKRDDMYKTKTVQAAISPDPSPPKSMVTESASISKEEESSDGKQERLAPEPATSAVLEVPSVLSGKDVNDPAGNGSVIPRPLSPFTAYEDLKPPSSPCPTPPSSKSKKIETADAVPGTLYTTSGVSDSEADASVSNLAEVKKPKMQPLSPYIAYEDLKPPSSPSPSPPNSRKEPSEPTITVDGVPKVIGDALVEEVSQKLKFYQSPYPVYDDLKPPTSPTPAAPSSSTSLASADSDSQTATLSSNDAVERVAAENIEDEHNPIKPKPRPLSPYTMYHDMKPPTTPMPSPRSC